MFTKKTIKAQNSRRFKRLRAEYLIKYQMPGSDKTMLSNMKDLSAGGVKFWSETYIPEGSLVRVSFLVPPLERAVESLARVVRVRQTAAEEPVFYLAVRFIEISEDAKEAIKLFIDELAEQPETKKYVSDAALVKRTVIL